MVCDDDFACHGVLIHGLLNFLPVGGGDFLFVYLSSGKSLLALLRSCSMASTLARKVVGGKVCVWTW
jgi:hypothetical protein